MIPGVTTVKRNFGVVEGHTEDHSPLDIDLYVDSSLSMVNPQQTVSYTTLAAVIVALSALRNGGRVQATLWSGASEWRSTKGFTFDEKDILRTITGYFGGSTAFPLHTLRDTYNSKKDNRPTHILVMSDDGVDTMFDTDELGNSGLDLAQKALATAGAGGTMVLQVPNYQNPVPAKMGWDVHLITHLPDLVAFARAFSHKVFV